MPNRGAERAGHFQNGGVRTLANLPWKSTDETGKTIKSNNFRTLEIDQRHTTNWKAYNKSKIQEKELNLSKNSGVCSILIWSYSHPTPPLGPWNSNHEDQKPQCDGGGWSYMKLPRKIPHLRVLSKTKAISDKQLGRPILHMPKATVLVGISRD